MIRVRPHGEPIGATLAGRRHRATVRRVTELGFPEPEPHAIATGRDASDALRALADARLGDGFPIGAAFEVHVERVR